FEQSPRSNEIAGAGRGGGNPGAGMRFERFGFHRRDAALGRRLQDQSSQRMLALLLCDGGGPQHFVRRSTVQTDDVAELQPSLGEGAGFVEGKSRYAGESFEGRAALDEDAGAGEAA